ncbi:MAG TPA: hypothetical protein VJM49_18880, partial [Acidimicrobiales bacterium]|nr:hypothetical protein [Acidimicrobiales bacterium]
MSEIVDLIAVLAAIDVAVGDEDDDRRAQVAALVPAYRVGDRFGWNERFVERPDVRELPTIEEAMRNLAEPSRFASMLP